VAPVDIYKLCQGQIEEQVLLPLRRLLQSGKFPYKGVLYAGLMITARPGNAGKKAYQPYVLEFNARFGDPETQALLPLLESDLLEILWACTKGKLNETQIEWSRKASCCVLAVADTYPESSSQGQTIILSKMPADSYVFHGGTKLSGTGSTLLTNGGRILAVTAIAPSLDNAAQIAYDGLGKVEFPGMAFRKDVGRAASACLSH
jgi:phosphoribosylamine---glycine ligase